MDIVIYDGSFKGLLTAIFEVYEYKMQQPLIHREGEASQSLFGKSHMVHTSDEKSERVWNKLDAKLSAISMRQLYKTFLSEINGIENYLLRYVQYILSTKNIVENDYSNPDVLMIKQTSRKVDREKHRMEAFVRFALTKDELYYSIIQPDFNVLPLIKNHFEKRYADQCWLIYDIRRKYGLYYDMNDVTEVQIDFTTDLQNAEAKNNLYDENEILYQELWKQYFTSVNIKARKNPKLHIQHMPKRYWKYLVEKQ